MRCLMGTSVSPGYSNVLEIINSIPEWFGDFSQDFSRLWSSSGVGIDVTYLPIPWNFR